MSKIAYYEKNFAGAWCLAVYAEPQSNKTVNGPAVERSAPFEVPDSCIENGQVNLTKVEELFPNPDN